MLCLSVCLSASLSVCLSVCLSLSLSLLLSQGPYSWNASGGAHKSSDSSSGVGGSMDAGTIPSKVFTLYYWCWSWERLATLVLYTCTYWNLPTPGVSLSKWRWFMYSCSESPRHILPAWVYRLGDKGAWIVSRRGLSHLGSYAAICCKYMNAITRDTSCSSCVPTVLLNILTFCLLDMPK